jgi:hypothetical protein
VASVTDSCWQCRSKVRAVVGVLVDPAATKDGTGFLPFDDVSEELAATLDPRTLAARRIGEIKHRDSPGVTGGYISPPAAPTVSSTSASPSSCPPRRPTGFASSASDPARSSPRLARSQERHKVERLRASLTPCKSGHLQGHYGISLPFATMCASRGQDLTSWI